MFAIIWSIGTTTTLDGRVKFNAWIRNKMQEMNVEFPEEKLVYDYKFNHETKEW
jgi:dynein heavy chain